MKSHEEFLDVAVNEYKLDGIECFYSEFTEKQREYLKQYCINNNIYMSGGSDYHGNNKKVKLGVGNGDLKIQLDCAKDWIKI